MKSKLLLSLGLASILGMAQASEVTPEVRNIMEMFARLSPADQALVRTGILNQEHVPVVREEASAIEDTTVPAVPAVREEASALPKWIEEQFGKGYRGEDVHELSFVKRYEGAVETYMSRRDIDGWKYYSFKKQGIF